MTDDYLDPNPQSHHRYDLAPFGGRESVFARIQQYLIDPADRHALLFIGRKSIGKTATLYQCQQILGEHVIGCYLPLENIPFTNEADWLLHLVNTSNQVLEIYQLNTTRLPELPDEPVDYRLWLTDIFLPELEKLIRPHRRIVWLMDDIEHLLSAVEAGTLPDDSLSFLYELLQAHLQLGIVVTLSEQNESWIHRLNPLIDVNQIQRLHPLSAEQSANVIVQYVPQITDAAQATIYRLTDGHPLILQLIGQALKPIITHQITETDVRSIIDGVYIQVDDIYRRIWQHTLSQNERLVLTAISGLLYDDPLIVLTTPRIESWLLETDFPLDITSINAGIRGLEYQDLVVGSTSEGIRLRAQLFQRWLIEHARIDKPATYPMKPNTITEDDNIPINRRGVIILSIVIVVLMLIVTLAQQSNTGSSIPPQPTVTLGTD